MHFWCLSHGSIFLSHAGEETFRLHSQQMWRCVDTWQDGVAIGVGVGWVARNQSSKTHCVTTSRVVGWVLLVSDSRDTWLAAVTGTAAIKKLNWARPWARDKSAPDAPMTVTAVSQWENDGKCCVFRFCSLTETKKAGFFFFTSGPSAWKRKFESCHQQSSKVTEFSLTAGWKSFRLVCLPPGVNSLCLLSVITLPGTQLLLCLSIQFQQQKVTNTRGTFQYWSLDGCSWGRWLLDCPLSSFWNVLSGWKTWTLPDLCVNPRVLCWMFICLFVYKTALI